MENSAIWVASLATMTAALMTAANLGTRITGWGFVVFTIGSIAWAGVGFLSGQHGLLITNAFLFTVNVFGVWRWLGRQARYEEGSAVAAARSRARPHVPTLFSGAGLIGAHVEDCNGGYLGTIVDTMLTCHSKQLSYIVVARGGFAGAGETLRALRPSHFTVSQESVRCNLTADQVAALSPIDDVAWPAAARELHVDRQPREAALESRSHDCAGA